MCTETVLFLIFNPQNNVNCKQRQCDSGSKPISKGISSVSITLFQITVLPYQV